MVVTVTLSGWSFVDNINTCASRLSFVHAACGHCWALVPGHSIVPHVCVRMSPPPPSGRRRGRVLTRGRRLSARPRPWVCSPRTFSIGTGSVLHPLPTAAAHACGICMPQPRGPIRKSQASLKPLGYATLQSGKENAEPPAVMPPRTEGPREPLIRPPVFWFRASAERVDLCGAKCFPFSYRWPVNCWFWDRTPLDIPTGEPATPFVVLSPPFRSQARG